jgi:hypothetical protein
MGARSGYDGLPTMHLRPTCPSLDRTSSRRRLFPLLVAMPVAAVLVIAMAASAPAAQAGEIPRALIISRSSNKNEVTYAVRVDDACAPTGANPVRVYWRMLERGRDVVEPLRADEERAFGIGRQQSDAAGVHLTLRGLPARAITIRTARAPGGTCSASVLTTIAGVPARVASVQVHETLFGVGYVQLTGWSEAGAVVRERLSP